MRKRWQSWRWSLTTRLLLLFAIASALIVGLLVVTLAHGFRVQWQSTIRPHLEQYLDLVNAEIGVPPDLQRVRQMANRLPINIYVHGPNVKFSSSGRPLDLERLEFRRRPPRYHAHDRHRRIDFGELHDRTVLRNRLGAYTVYYELRHTRRRPPHDNGVLLAMAALLTILLGCYLILRRMLRPVQDITHGVVKMGAGQLQTRVPIRANNDLGALASSINTMAADIEQMLDAKRQLLLGASHELRTPITRAKVAIQLMPESANRDRIADDLEEMSSLVTDILESERIKGGHSVLNRSEVDLPALLDSVMAELHDPPLALDIQADLPRLQLDETRVRLLLRNLLSNALTHGAAQQQPTVTLRMRSATARQVEIVVRDFGPGIAAEHQQRITEPFYRADPSRARTTGGFGLGLHLCLLIAQAHGGELLIKSELQRGTVVTAILQV